jgi:predicted dithiol-disulfide oxidoreductase (DUF899 family)
LRVREKAHTREGDAIAAARPPMEWVRRHDEYAIDGACWWRRACCHCRARPQINIEFAAI